MNATQKYNKYILYVSAICFFLHLLFISLFPRFVIVLILYLSLLILNLSLVLVMVYYAPSLYHLIIVISWQLNLFLLFCTAELIYLNYSPYKRKVEITITPYL